MPNEIRGWHCVKESEPPTGTLVLCQGAHGGLFLGNSIGSGYFIVPNARSGRHAIAWHELPEPYEVKGGAR